MIEHITEGQAVQGGMENKESSKPKQDMNEGDPEYYKSAAKYWEGVPPTVNGMLGGFGKISGIGNLHNLKAILVLNCLPKRDITRRLNSLSISDIEGSNKFLKSLLKVCVCKYRHYN